MFSLNHLFRSHTHQVSQDRINDALLDRAEILDLYSRTQHRLSPFLHRYEVAHRNIGDVRSQYRGAGLDYEESRAYQYGDELRYMNWRLTARTGEMMMKVFREERRPDVFILLDRRAGMRFGTRRRLKVTQAVRAVAVAAFAAYLRNMAVSGVMLDSTAQWLDLRYGEQGVFDLIQRMCAPCPPATPDQANRDSVTGLTEVLSALCEILTPGTVLYLMSDFADLDEAHRTRLLQLVSQHNVHVIYLIDPAELSLPSAGRLGFVSLSGHETQVINTSNKDISERYTEASTQYIQQRQNLFRSLDIPCRQVLTTCEDIENEVLPADFIKIAY